jgi:hypothetical protein
MRQRSDRQQAKNRAVHLPSLPGQVALGASIRPDLTIPDRELFSSSMCFVHETCLPIVGALGHREDAAGIGAQQHFGA